jgi:hypothetical protein
VPTIRVRPRVLNTRLALVGLGAIAAAGVMTMPAAHADPDGLVAWARGAGFTGSTVSIQTRGALVCADLDNGDNGEQAAFDLWLNTGIVALSDARLFVIAAVDQLCPQFDHRHDAPAASISQTFVA